jgi:hypothetical protein
MAKQKALSTQLKEANAQIEKLTSELKSKSESFDTYYKMYNDSQLELESVHTALDTMFVPGKVKQGYSEKTMTIASRLFAWQAGARVEPPKKTEVE